jgi:hypothetical protein
MSNLIEALRRSKRAATLHIGTIKMTMLDLPSSLAKPAGEAPADSNHSSASEPSE